MLSFCLMPQLHLFQDVSHALLQNKCRIFVERKKRLWRWFHCVWSVRLCVVWILFSLLNIVSNCHIWFASLCTGGVCYFQVQYWVRGLGQQNHSERSRMIAKHTQSLSSSSKSARLRASGVNFLWSQFPQDIILDVLFEKKNSPMDFSEASGLTNASFRKLHGCTSGFAHNSFSMSSKAFCWVLPHEKSISYVYG